MNIEENPKPLEGEDQVHDTLTSDYVSGVKERAQLKEEIETLTKEVNRVKSQNYDLTKKIEKLENEKTESRKQSGQQKKGRKKRPAKRKTPKKKTSSSSSVGKQEDESEKEDPFENMDLLYEEIAKQFPTLPLSTILVAQQKFTEADVNNDGTIDSVELENVLDSAALFVTKSEVKEMLKNIDADESDSIDFFECLKVCDQLHNNRKTSLPRSLQNQKSALCSIQ
ncbi:uncharacterized protein [Clytia hemisphaerica]|uniref:EF-hand domain-containing protein n=1 Tax=Clytia hemisphaerica TaxID=252671 RepID=A0A7M5WQI6_9CNID|eukprot:TCONS_00007634-protein